MILGAGSGGLKAQAEAWSALGAEVGSQLPSLALYLGTTSPTHLSNRCIVQGQKEYVDEARSLSEQTLGRDADVNGRVVLLSLEPVGKFPKLRYDKDRACQSGSGGRA